MKTQLHRGDCLEILKTLPDASVDLVLTDPPYGTTSCKWDTVIPLPEMWEELDRVVKPRAAVVLFGSLPFSATLVSSNLPLFRYCWMWRKTKGGGHFSAKKRPMRRHEEILVFGKSPRYFPQGLRVNPSPKGNKGKGRYAGGGRAFSHDPEKVIYTNYPKTILEFSSVGRAVHPTEKPVDLLRYLVRTYTLPGETVLDFTMGSGSTGVACREEGRAFVGIELDPDYFQIAKERIEREPNQ